MRMKLNLYAWEHYSMDDEDRCVLIAIAPDRITAIENILDKYKIPYLSDFLDENNPEILPIENDITWYFGTFPSSF